MRRLEVKVKVKVAGWRMVNFTVEMNHVRMRELGVQMTTTMKKGH